ncbi:hypothetical protein ACPA9J_00080 [Pseudomonas aeruginosa]
MKTSTPSRGQPTDAPMSLLTGADFDQINASQRRSGASTHSCRCGTAPRRGEGSTARSPATPPNGAERRTASSAHKHGAAYGRRSADGDAERSALIEGPAELVSSSRLDQQLRPFQPAPRCSLGQPGKGGVSYKATTWKNKRRRSRKTKVIRVRHQTCTAWTTGGVQIPTFSPEELRKKVPMLSCCHGTECP